MGDVSVGLGNMDQYDPQLAQKFDFETYKHCLSLISCVFIIFPNSDNHQ